MVGANIAEETNDLPQPHKKTHKIRHSQAFEDAMRTATYDDFENRGPMIRVVEQELLEQDSISLPASGKSSTRNR